MTVQLPKEIGGGIKIEAKGQDAGAIIDSGASFSFAAQPLLDALKKAAPEVEDHLREIMLGTGAGVVKAQALPRVNVCIKGCCAPTGLVFVPTPLPFPIALGSDFLVAAKGSIDFEACRLSCNGKDIAFECPEPESGPGRVSGLETPLLRSSRPVPVSIPSFPFRRR